MSSRPSVLDTVDIFWLLGMILLGAFLLLAFTHHAAWAVASCIAGCASLYAGHSLNSRIFRFPHAQEIVAKRDPLPLQELAHQLTDASAVPDAFAGFFLEEIAAVMKVEPNKLRPDDAISDLAKSDQTYESGWRRRRTVDLRDFLVSELLWVFDKRMSDPIIARLKEFATTASLSEFCTEIYKAEGW